ncbi:MAG TPA: oligosaccharide flippase family protein [Ohtaekwangia sp.]|uniref:lipopolysaccharide biosynthesis protein n=1 Tax=Ohtaekwangia sp. TaxID=2066019 RepID=UPI002F93E3DF
MLKKVFSHTAIYGLAPYIPKLFSFFALPIITKDLSATDYGVAGFVTAYVGAIGVFNTLGLRIILVNSFYHYRSQFKWLWRQLYGFLSLWILVFAIITTGVLLFAIPSEAKANAPTIILLNVIPLVCFGPVSMIGSTYFQLKQKPMQIATRTILFGLLSVGLNIYMISYLKLGYMGWFWTECIVGLLSNASYWYAVNIQLGLKPIFRFKSSTIIRSLKTAMPTVPHYYATYLLNSSDRMVMDILKIPTNQVGKYNLAANFGNYFGTLATASGLATGPMLNSLYKEGKDIVARNLIFMLQGAFFLLTFIFCLWSKEIFYLLIRNEVLRQAYPFAIILIMSYNYRPMYFASNAKILFFEKTSVLWRVSFGAGVINILLNFTLIPVFGVVIASVTTFVAYMYMGYIGFTFKTFKDLNNGVKHYPLVWLIATVILTAAAYVLVELPVMAKASATVVLLGIAFILYKKFKKHLVN